MARGEELLAAAEQTAAGDETPLARVRWLQAGLRNARLTLDVQRTYEAYRETGAIGPYREALTQLDDFRASVEGDFTANMGYLAWAEQRTWDRELLRLMAQPGEPLPGPWLVQWDPDGVGEEPGWFRADHADPDWLKTGVSGPGEELPVGRRWREEHGEDYNGLAWYRTGFLVPRDDAGRRARLIFGAVDEACVVWLNGRRVLDRPYPFGGDTESWQKAFEVDITDAARYGEPNLLAVRVEDNTGAGGIWRPVWLAIDEPRADAEANVIGDGGFEGDAAAWKKSVMTGEFAFALDADRPHSGAQSARIECAALGPPEVEEQYRTRVWGRWYQAIGPVDPETTYRLRLWARTSDDFGGRLAIWVTGAGEGTLAANVLNTEGLWHEVTIDDIHPDGEQRGLYLNLMHGTGTAWFDDVELVAVD